MPVGSDDEAEKWMNHSIYGLGLIVDQRYGVR